MNSTTSPTSGFFSSPRRQQLMLWASGAVLVIGVAVFLAVYLTRGGNTQAASTNISTVSSPPAQTNQQKPPPTVPAAHSALENARTFLLTAVQRKNLDASYGIVGPYVKGGLTLKQWRTGNIPVTPYPSFNAKTTPLVVKSSTKDEVILDVVLDPTKASGIKKPQGFKIVVDRIGGKWLVNSFQPDYTIPVQVNPNN